MVGMGVLRVMMVVIMCVRVIMRMAMIVVVIVVMVLHFQPAHTRAECITQFAVFDIGTGGRCALTFHMVVVAFLHRAHFGLKPQHLGAV